MEIPEDVQRGHELAKQALAFAYAPYSRYRVGCAIKTFGDEHIYSGCNVENVVSPAGICAERSVITSLFGKRDSSLVRIEWIVVVTDCSLGDAPCGMCQQVISEFAGPDLPIYIGNLQQIKACYTLEEIRPINYLFPHRQDEFSQ